MTRAGGGTAPERRRLLVVQTAYLGDMVMTTPLLRALRRASPGARITVLASPAGAGVLGASPDVDEVLVYDKAGQQRGSLATVRMARELRRRGFDAAVAAQRSFRTGVLVAASGAPRRVGFAGAPGRWAYTDGVLRCADRHAVWRYLELGRPLGCRPDEADPRPRLAVDPAASRRVDGLLQRAGLAPGEPLLCVAPGASRPTKRWLPERFAEAAAAARRLGLCPVLVGAPHEAPLCREVAGRLDGPAPVLAGRTGLPELVALIARSRAVLGNDSGPAHVAAALGVPAVSVFGPTGAAAGLTPWGDRARVVELEGLDCRPCSARGPRRCPAGHFRCMRDLGATPVVEALAALLAGDPAAPAASQSLMTSVRPGYASSAAASASIARPSPRSSIT